jgi:hypothetical protein
MNKLSPAIKNLYFDKYYRANNYKQFKFTSQTDVNVIRRDIVRHVCIF